MQVADSDTEAFTEFVDEAQDRVRYALVAAFGADRGSEATAEAFGYAWQHWERVASMENPAGYVFRVGQRWASRRPKRMPVVFPDVASELPWIEPGLPDALVRLSERQRMVVVLVHGFGYPQREVAALLGVSPGSVQRHLDRGLAKLRKALGVASNA